MPPALSAEYLLSDQGRSDAHWGLWTALATSYSRPFLKSRVGRVSARLFERFDDDAMKAHHALLLRERKRLFAHNDLVPIVRAVYAFPPGSWGKAGSTTIGLIRFHREAAEGALALCHLQTERARARIAELVDELYGNRAWSESEMLELEYPDVADVGDSRASPSQRVRARPKKRAVATPDDTDD
jgi:hypothetical protein